MIGTVRTLKDVTFVFEEHRYLLCAGQYEATEVEADGTVVVIQDFGSPAKVHLHPSEFRFTPGASRPTPHPRP